MARAGWPYSLEEDKAKGIRIGYPVCCRPLGWRSTGFGGFVLLSTCLSLNMAQMECTFISFSFYVWFFLSIHLFSCRYLYFSFPKSQENPLNVWKCECGTGKTESQLKMADAKRPRKSCLLASPLLFQGLPYQRTKVDTVGTVER